MSFLKTALPYPLGPSHSVCLPYTDRSLQCVLGSVGSPWAGTKEMATAARHPLPPSLPTHLCLSSLRMVRATETKLHQEEAVEGPSGRANPGFCPQTSYPKARILSEHLRCTFKASKPAETQRGPGMTETTQSGSGSQGSNNSQTHGEKE